MPLSVDQSGYLRLSWEFTLMSRPQDFPGRAVDVVESGRDAGKAAIFSRPGSPAMDWSPAMAVALACIEDEQASEKNGCSELFIETMSDGKEGRNSSWIMRCSVKLDKPVLFLSKARAALVRCWEIGEIDCLEETAYELFVASNSRSYSPDEAGLEMVSAVKGRSTLGMALAWMEARELGVAARPLPKAGDVRARMRVRI